MSLARVSPAPDTEDAALEELLEPVLQAIAASRPDEDISLVRAAGPTALRGRRPRCPGREKTRLSHDSRLLDTNSDQTLHRRREQGAFSAASCHPAWPPYTGRGGGRRAGSGTTRPGSGPVGRTAAVTTDWRRCGAAPDAPACSVPPGRDRPPRQRRIWARAPPLVAPTSNAAARVGPRCGRPQRAQPLKKPWPRSKIPRSFKMARSATRNEDRCVGPAQQQQRATVGLQRARAARRRSRGPPAPA